MQKRYHNFEAEITSYDSARATVATNRPGRYGGFDTLTSQSALSFKVGHSSTGITTTDQLGVSVGPLGHAVTLQGVIIEETEEVGPLTIDTNAGNSAVRYDAVILRHTYTSVAGGAAATYLIKKGPINNPIFPVVDNPQTDVMLGILEIPAGATILTPVIYSPMPTPDSGGEKDAKINSVNTYQKLQQFKKGTSGGPTFDNSLAGETLLTLKSDGNCFELSGTISDMLQGLRFDLSTSVQEGTKITLILNAGIGIVNNFNLSSTAIGQGYRPFFIPQTFQDGATGTIAPPAQGDTKIIEVMMLNQKYTVTHISNTGTLVNRTVSVDDQDTKPGSLKDKLTGSDYIAMITADTPNSGRTLSPTLKGKQATWDNVWKNMNLTLDGNHTLVSGAVAKYKIDFFGVLYIRDLLIQRTPSLNTNFPVTITIVTLPVTLPRDVIMPLAITSSMEARGMSGFITITSSGVLKLTYCYDVQTSTVTPVNSVVLHVGAVCIDTTPNP